MQEHSGFGLFILVLVYFLPATITFVFAWFMWIANVRPEITRWRVDAFKWSLVCSPICMALFAPGMIHRLATFTPSSRVLLIANWLGLPLWLSGFTTALLGKGPTRAILFFSYALLFLGVPMVYAIVP